MADESAPRVIMPSRPKSASAPAVVRRVVPAIPLTLVRPQTKSASAADILTPAPTPEITGSASSTSSDPLPVNADRIDPHPGSNNLGHLTPPQSAHSADAVTPADSGSDAAQESTPEDPNELGIDETMKSFHRRSRHDIDHGTSSSHGAVTRHGGRAHGSSSQHTGYGASYGTAAGAHRASNNGQAQGISGEQDAQYQPAVGAQGRLQDFTGAHNGSVLYPPGLAPVSTHATFSAGNAIAHGNGHLMGPNAAQYQAYMPMDNGQVGYPMSRSISNSSSANNAQNGIAMFDQITSPVIPVPMNGPTMPWPQDAVIIREYLSRHYGNRAFADFEIVITTSKDAGVTVPPFPAHGLILGRSSVLGEMIARGGHAINPVSGCKILRISLEDNFSTIYSILEAIGYLYGLPLPLLQPVNNAAFQITQLINQALAFAAAGVILSIPEVVYHGVQAVVPLINWDNIEVMLAFAINEPKSGKAAKPVEWFFTVAMSWIIRNFPKDFKMDEYAAQLSMIRRLPVILQARPSVSNPDIARIQFGENSLDQSVRVILTSIFLSLPFELLQDVLTTSVWEGSIGVAKLGELMQDIVKAREDRRHEILNKKVIPSTTRKQMDEVKWEERVVADASSSSGFKLARVPFEEHQLERLRPAA